jgi:hypothetical protein
MAIQTETPVDKNLQESYKYTLLLKKLMPNSIDGFLI